MTTARSRTRSADQDKKRLKRLAAFGPKFRDRKTVFGRWHEPTGKGTLQDPLTMPWFELSEVANKFVHMTYDSGWILQNFDWMKWVRRPEVKKLLGSRNAIASADCQQLAKLLTAFVRNDRFVEGWLAKAYKDKILLAIVERAEALIKATTGTSGKRKKASANLRA